MESKYKERATKLVNQNILRLLAPNSDLAGGIVELMCQLAEEVESLCKNPMTFDAKTNQITMLYSKAYVKELLQQQRELCTEKAKIRLSVDGLETIEKEFYPQYSDEHYSIDEDSIKNAKLKID